MSYEELVALWRNQRSQYQTWELQLLNSPMVVRDAVETELSIADLSWKEHGTGALHKYVEVMDFYGLAKPENTKRLRHEAITTDGVLIFGIGITFDYGVDAYPKSGVYIPLASRVLMNGPEFAFFCKDTDAPDGSWSTNVAEFSKAIIARYRDYLSHNPYAGFGSKIRMGFL